MLAKLFRDISASCLPGSPLTHALLNAAADDLDAGGVTSRAMAGSERDRPGTVPGLRFAAALHHLVLDGRAPALAKHYPSVGGEPQPGRGSSGTLLLLRGRSGGLDRS